MRYKPSNIASADIIDGNNALAIELRENLNLYFIIIAIVIVINDVVTTLENATWYIEYWEKILTRKITAINSNILSLNGMCELCVEWQSGAKK